MILPNDRFDGLVVRKTEVDDIVNDMDERTLSKLDSKLMAEYMMSQQKRTANNNPDDSGPPLVTNAIRQLEKAKRELVYNQCIVRIR